ncbi:MAG: DUF4384 domain-containing protein [Pseudomonadota bacterium]
MSGRQFCLSGGVCLLYACVISSTFFGLALAGDGRGSGGDRGPQSTAIPGPSTDPISLKAYAVFKTHCARCHQSGELKSNAHTAVGEPLRNDTVAQGVGRDVDIPAAVKVERALRPAAGFGQILDLDGLAASPQLIQPGLPDGSRLYQMLVSRHMPFDVFQPTGVASAQRALAGPNTFDIEAVRDWIVSLSPTDGFLCGGRWARARGAADRYRALSRWWTGPLLLDEERKRLALVQLSGEDFCDLGPSVQSRSVEARRRLVRLLGVNAEDVTVIAVPGLSTVAGLLVHSGAVHAVDLQALANQQSVNVRKSLRNMGSLIPNGPPVFSLSWLKKERSSVSVSGGGAGLKVAAAQPVHTVASTTETSSVVALGGGGSRIGDGATALRAADDEPVLPNGLTLSTQLSVLRSGDDVVVRVRADRDCRLTLINIEQGGRATVVFPNRFQSDNTLRAGRPQTIPAPSSPFALKLNNVGRETFVAICLLEDRETIPGVRHDFELQPFTILGDWRAHIRWQLEADAQERGLVGKRVSRRKTRRLRRKGIIKRKSKAPLRQMRAAISIDVQPRVGD